MYSRAMKHYNKEQEEKLRNNPQQEGPQATAQPMKWNHKKKLHQQPAREIPLNTLRALDPTLVEYERG